MKQKENDIIMFLCTGFPHKIGAGKYSTKTVIISVVIGYLLILLGVFLGLRGL